MSIESTIRQHVQELYRDGKTQQEVGDKLNISRSYIQSLMTGRRRYGGITVEYLDKMFPRATLNLTGTGNIMQVASNVRVQNGSVNSIQNGKTAEQFRQEAIMKMLELDLDGDTLKSVLTALKGIEV